MIRFLSNATIGLFACMLISLQVTTAQDSNIKEWPIFNGYHSTLSGFDFTYYSSIPSAKESLLIRATDGLSAMEWLTSEIPWEYQEDSIRFAWLAGIGSSPGDAAFDLYLSDKLYFTFRSDGSNAWKYRHESGATLSFSKDMIDQHGDRFGFMYLTIPVTKDMKGKPVRLKVIGQKYGKTSWYMTFRFPLEHTISLKTLPAIHRIGNQEYQLCTMGLLHTGIATSLKLTIDNQLVVDTMVQFGYNYIKFFIPYQEKNTNLNYSVSLGNEEIKAKLDVQPVKKWRINLVQHAHTDIGYTRSQTEILAEHLRYIDYALDYCDLTDSYPESSQFRWTCEASWAVDEYLKSRPQSQIDRLKQRVKEGRIELTGMYFNFSELPDEQVLAASLKPIERIHKAGMPVKTAMQNDVNGIAWNLIDMYADLGVEYVNMGTHGHRALICFDLPTLFWWEAPSGKRLLAYRAEHYMLGNTRFKIHAGDFDVFEDELLSYLLELQAKGYAYDLISIQHSGFLVDNSPPSLHASEMIRMWNEKYSWPRLKTATTHEFFDEMKEKHGSEFEVVHGAWPDWWTDGFGASAREVAATRRAGDDLVMNTAGASMALLAGEALPEHYISQIDAVNEALLFYTEHTVGYHASVREPFHPYTMEQRAIKESYAWEAARRAKMLGEASSGMLVNYVGNAILPSIVVFNSLNWLRDAVVKVYIDHQILPRFTSFTIEDEHGNIAMAQAVEYHSDGTYWLIQVKDVPAFGYKRYFIRLHPEKAFISPILERKAVQAIENQYYALAFDTLSGSLISWKDKRNGLELLAENPDWKFGQFVHEKLDNREQLESFTLNNFMREAASKLVFEGMEQSPVYTAVRYKADTETGFGEKSLGIEYRLYKAMPKLEVVYTLNKKLITEPEAIYIAFPFQLKDAQHIIEVPGGEMRAGIDQIKGSSNDWNTIQNYTRLTNGEYQITSISGDAPLFQFGGINTGRYKAGAIPASSQLFGWPMNNYWTTNFNADQHGGHSIFYQFITGAGEGMKEAVRQSRDIRIPMLARVLPAAGSQSLKIQANEGSFIEGFPENACLISAIPLNQRALLLQIREIEGKEVKLNLKNALNGKTLKLYRTDANGNKLADSQVVLNPYETAFFKVEW